MRRSEWVVFALAAPGEAAEAAALPKRPDAVAPPGDDLVRIGLMTNVPDQFVLRRIEDIVKRHRQLDHAEGGSQMAAGHGHGRNHFLAKFVSDGDVDWQNLGTAIRTAVRFLDDVIAATPYFFAENQKQRVNALVFVGDAMEEKVDRLCQLAGELGLKGVPIFLFHEGGDPVAARAFQQMAKLSRGAYLRFDLASADRLKDLLGAVAVYAAGGYRALTAYGEKKGGEVLRLTAQLRG